MNRELLQIVELDVNRCGLAYGSNPCIAALGTTGVRKCYNTYATCQNKVNFGAPSEPSGGPDRTFEQLDTFASTGFVRNADLFFAANLSIPSADPDGCIWELGGASTGAYLGYTSGNLIWRVGDGGSGTPANCAKLDLNLSGLLGKTGTIYGQAFVATNRIELWFWEQGTSTVTLLGTDTAVGSFSDWAGSAAGAVGRVNGAYPTGESGANYNGTISEVRFYDSTNFEPVGQGDANTTTLRFAKNQNGIPRSQRVYPALQSVSTNPTEINLGGVNDRLGSLGKRARISVKLKDFTDSDIWFDNYQAERVDGTAQTDEGGYNPQERGTFFGKLRRRFPYYVGRALRVKEGYVGDDVATMRTRNYVVTEWAGPDAAGNVTITASDVLDLAGDKKAQAPAASQGRLAVAVAESGLPSFNLVPADVGDEYPASGTAAIGSEIVTFTRSGDTVTLTARAQGGSTASSHSADDTFQTCYVANDATIASVAIDLMTNYAGIDASYIDTAAWTSEGERWLATYSLTTIITKPTGVTKLLAELSQFGVIWWWDDEDQEIRMRANRPLDVGETAPALSDSVTFIEDKSDTADLYDQRLSRVFFYHGVIDYTQSTTDGDNFRRVSVAIDGEAESKLEYDQTQSYEIFSRWLGEAGDYAVATPAVKRLLNRYRDTPRQFVFEFDVKDEASVAVASPVTIQSRLIQDETGNNLATQMQITSIEETVGGHRFKAKAQNYQFDGRYGFITENSRAVYGSSTDAEKTKGTYFVDENTLEFSDGTGPYLFF